jgi:carbonic anhydrase
MPFKLEREKVMQIPKSLLEGHWRFLRHRHAPEKGRYLQLAELGQMPTAMVIACCDASRRRFRNL